MPAPHSTNRPPVTLHLLTLGRSTARLAGDGGAVSGSVGCAVGGGAGSGACRLRLARKRAGVGNPPAGLSSMERAATIIILAVVVPKTGKRPAWLWRGTPIAWGVRGRGGANTFKPMLDPGCS